MERYEILNEIARGANGVVYRVLDRELGRTIALKKLREEAGTSRAKERFLREARVAAQMEHSGIVPIHDFGLDSTRPYYTMPFVSGNSLADRLEDGRLEPVEAARITAHVARALAYAHQRGIIHRDVKPANILLGTDGRVLLADFGTTRDLSAPVRLTRTGELLGTPQYMSPEQMTPGRPTAPPSDIFSLGCVFYEMLCGRPPFQGDSFLDLSAHILNDDPKPPDGAPADLQALCLRCLRRNPDERPDAAELARLLEAEPGTKTEKGIRRNFTVRPALVAMLLLALTSLALRGNGVSSPRRPVPEEVPPGMVLDANAALFVDRTEVTCEQYAEFLLGTQRRPPLGWRSRRPPRGSESRPVGGVTADDADAYAKWRGARLPSSEEWESLARGSDGRAFPWGDVLPPSWPSDVDALEYARGPAPVGSAGYDLTPPGVFDLAGGVREWTSTPGALDRTRRVVRGGDWSTPMALRIASRYDEIPANKRDRKTGFRCVIDINDGDKEAQN